MRRRRSAAAAAGAAVLAAILAAADPGLAGHLYSAVWANLWTPSIWTLAAIGWHAAQSAFWHRERMNQAAAHHQDLKRHVTETAARS